MREDMDVISVKEAEAFLEEVYNEGLKKEKCWKYGNIDFNEDLKFIAKLLKAFELIATLEMLGDEGGQA